MKTLTTSILAMFAIACAPEASLDQNDTVGLEMDEGLESRLDDALSRTGSEEMILKRAQKELTEIHVDIDEDGAVVVGMITGTFDDNERVFKALGYGADGQIIYAISGDFPLSDDGLQRRLLSGEFISTVTGAGAESIPADGDWMGETSGDNYFGQQVAAGFTPLLHEGIWIEEPEGGSGHFIGLVAKHD